MDDSQLRSLIAGVNKAFYDRVYEDPWLKVVFQGRRRDHLEAQQTDFMIGAFGGPKTYAERRSTDVHPHVFVEELMWQLRETFLWQSSTETHLPEETQVQWLRTDDAFKHAIVKRSAADCSKRNKRDTLSLRTRIR